MSDFPYLQRPATLASPASTSLRSIIGLVFRRKMLVLTLFCSVLALVTVDTILTPRTYESRMKILVKNERADLIVSPEARTDMQAPGDVRETQVNSEIEILSSNDLLTRVVRACHLDKRKPTRKWWLGSQRQNELETAVRRVQRDLKISPIRKTDIIQVTYSAENPETAAAVLKQLSESYLDAHLSAHGNAGTQEFFRKQAHHFALLLVYSEIRLTDFRKRYNLESTGEQEEFIVRKMMDSQAELQDTNAALGETTNAMEQLQKQLAAEDPRMTTTRRVLPNQTSIERLNTMLAELENRRTQLIMNFRPEDRAVVEVEDEIAQTRAALKRANDLKSVEEATDINPLRQSLQRELSQAEVQEVRLRARHDGLAATLGKYRSDLDRLQTHNVEYDGLQREVKEAEENYLLYARKQEEARIADSLDRQRIANVAIIEAPTAQHLPVKPNVTLNLLVGLVLAGLISVGAAIGLQLGNRGFYTPAELEAIASFPVLATVPYESSLDSSLGPLRLPHRSDPRPFD